jgi:hypothetical protein
VEFHQFNFITIRISCHDTKLFFSWLFLGISAKYVLHCSNAPVQSVRKDVIGALDGMQVLQAKVLRSSSLSRGPRVRILQRDDPKEEGRPDQDAHRSVDDAREENIENIALGKIKK